MEMAKKVTRVFSFGLFVPGTCGLEEPRMPRGKLKNVLNKNTRITVIRKEHSSIVAFLHFCIF